MFQELRIRPDHEEDDRAEAQAVIRDAVTDRRMTVVVVRYPDSTAMGNHVQTIMGPRDDRQGFWVHDESIFIPGQEAHWFGDDAAVSVVVLDYVQQNRNAFRRFTDDDHPALVTRAVLEVEAGQQP